MSNKIKKHRNIEKEVMSQVNSESVKMKPQWYFIAGSVLTFIGLLCASAVSIFLINIVFFLINKNGLGYGKLFLMLISFPIWLPIAAVIGIITGVMLLRKYDFSYKNNYLLVVVAFISAVLVAGYLLDVAGLNAVWSHHGPMRRFYQQIESQGNFGTTGQMKIMQNGRR